MASSEIRLELLKLTYAHGRTADEAVERAKVLETYVDAVEAQEAPVTGTLRLPKKPGTQRAG
jgi:hypothetical protein